MNDRITIEDRDGAFGAYIARPKALAAPAVVVLQDCSESTPTFGRPVTNWPGGRSIAVAIPIYSGACEPGVDLNVTLRG